MPFIMHYQSSSSPSSSASTSSSSVASTFTSTEPTPAAISSVTPAKSFASSASNLFRQGKHEPPEQMTTCEKEKENPSYRSEKKLVLFWCSP
jgi:hypothetical protein